MARSPVFTLALGLTTALFACQDQGVVAPNDLDPLFGVDCIKNPGHPKCTDPDPDPDPPPDPDAIMVLYTAGFNPGELGDPWDWMEWDPGHDPGLILELYSHNPFETDLSATYNSMAWDDDPAEDGEWGPCTYEPANAPDSVIVALAEQLDGIVVYANPEDKYNIHGLRINVEQAGTSLENFVRFLYISDHPFLRYWDKRRKAVVDAPIGLQVGGAYNAQGDTEVTVVEGEEFDTYTYTGGTVSVAHRAGSEIRLQCLLKDVVEVQVRMN